MTAPRRLLEDGAMPPDLMRALNGAPGEPTTRELAALASALGDALGMALPPPGLAKALPGAKAPLAASATASAAKSLVVLGTWVVGGLALGAGGFVGGGLFGGAPPPPPPPPRAPPPPAVTRWP